MCVLKLLTHDFRNLKNGSIELHPDYNFIIGENGSGKSSLLEAFFFLGHGKSFRTAKIDNLVAHNKDSFVVSVKEDSNKQLGVNRNCLLNTTSIKIDGIKFTRLSELAKNIAVQIVTPESFKLFFGGPKERRRFVDLGLFHVEHTFAKQWQDFNKILKHRNACLRSRANKNTLDYWTDLFCTHSDIIAQQRSSYVELLSKELNIWLEILLPNINTKIGVQYSQGWKQQSNLREVLINNIEREFSVGYSLYGTQKFDIKFLLDKTPIENQLSRGQQKLFLLALTFAQAKLIEKVKRLKPILLIDDVGAELDIISRTLLSKAINRLDCQVIITAIDSVALEPLVPDNKNYKMFHVKHGDISTMSE